MIRQTLGFGFSPGLAELIIIGSICLLFIGIPAVVVAVIYFSRRQSGETVRYGRMPCPECGESIVAEAVKCRFCGARLDDADIDPAEESRSTDDE